MTTAAIAYTNLVDTATSLSATTSATLMPIDRLVDPNVLRKWRSTNATAAFVIDVGSLTTIDTIAVMGLTATTIRVRLSTTDPSGVTAVIYDSGTQNVDQNYKQFVALATALPSPGTSRYVRVDLFNGAGAYVEAGRAFAGSRTHFDTNAAFGWTKDIIDPSVKVRMRSGGVQVMPEQVYVRMTMTFEFLTETERTGIVDTIDHVKGSHSDVLFVLNPDASNLAIDSIWGMIDPNAVQHRAVDVYQKQYVIEQRL